MTAVTLREGESAAEFRAAAKASGDADQARRLLSLAAIRDGLSRAEAARIGAMDRQTLRDWVHAYNEHGIAGLINGTSTGRKSKLTPEVKAEIKRLVEKGPDLERDGVVRWRRIDLARIVKNRFGIVVDEDTIGRALREMGYSHISVRPQHPEQPEGAVDDFKKNSGRSSSRR